MLSDLPPSELVAAIAGTRREGRHTEYVIRVEPKCGGRSDSEVVYRPFSAFVQLQDLAMRHLAQGSKCTCGQQGVCLLAPFLEPVFAKTKFPSTRAKFLGENSKSVVREREVFLNAFLQALQEALYKCPPIVLKHCDGENCRVLHLLKGFYGCFDENLTPSATDSE